MVKVEVAQLCPTLCDPMDYTVHGILQARILEWIAFPFSRGSFPSPGDLPNPGIEPRFPALQVESLSAEPQGKMIGKYLLGQYFTSVILNFTSRLSYMSMNCSVILPPSAK